MGDVVSLTAYEGKSVSDPVDEYVPSGFETQTEFLEYMRKEFRLDVEFDKDNRIAALEDLKFIAGEQWDDMVAEDRKAKGRPCLTINVLPQFIGQVIGDRRLNKTAIKVRPLKNATTALAEIRAGIIKGIEAQSRAERVYDAACEAQVSCGISNFRVDMEYAGNDVFDQDLLIRHIPNPLACVWDRMSIDSTGRDARHVFVEDVIPRDVYDRRFGDKYPCPVPLGNDSTSKMISDGWFGAESVRITEFWEMIEKPARFALMADGDTKDITNMQPEEYEHELWINPETGQPRIRDSFRTYARMHLVTGFAILGEAYELPLTRLPIIRVEGRIVQVGDERVRYGLIRYAKDSVRLKNYWRSVAAERLAMAPKAYFMASADAVEGRENKWRESHDSGDPLLIHNKNTEAPTPVPAPDVPVGLLQEAQLNQQDIKDVTGLHDASLGIRSNEVSGKAINARQREGDIATVIYHDNLNASIQECGDVLNQLIPLAYDTMRTLRVVGGDDKHKLVVVNDPNDEDSPNITAGKYDVEVETGPSFTTQRQEALDAMMTLVQTAPELMGVIGDLVAQGMDWPGATQIARRLRKGIDPSLLDEDERAEQEAEQGQQEEQQDPMQMMQLQQAQEMLEHEAQMREITLAKEMAAARKAEADADKAEAEAEKAKIEAEAAPAQLEQKHEIEAANAEVALRDKVHSSAQRLSHTDEQHSQKLEHGERQVSHKLSLADRVTSAKERQRGKSTSGTGPRPAGDRPKGRSKGNKK